MQALTLIAVIRVILHQPYEQSDILALLPQLNVISINGGYHPIEFFWMVQIVSYSPSSPIFMVIDQIFDFIAFTRQRFLWMPPTDSCSCRPL